MKTDPIINQKLNSGNSILSEPVFNILLVEDNPGDVVIVKELLKITGLNFNLTNVKSLRETISTCSQNEFDVILLDLGLPDSIGIDTLIKAGNCTEQSPVIVMTGLDDEDIALESLRVGAQDYLVKNRLTSDSILRSIKYGIERKKIEDLQKRHILQFAILSSATESITRCEDIPSIYKITCQKINSLITTANAIAIEFDDHTTFRISYFDWLVPWIEKIKSLTGFDFTNPVFHLDNFEMKLLDLFKDGNLHEIKGGLNEIFDGNLKPSISSQLGKLIGINKIYAIGFKKAENFYGGTVIFSMDIIKDNDIKIIETISSEASLNIHKMTIERELRKSENRFRKLSEELDLIVKDRTKDLEFANFQLQLELVDRILAQEALKTSETQLKELNATKDKFFNIVAHDLKNPFTSLLGSSELLYKNIHRMDKDTIKKLAIILNDSAKSGYAILENLLDWSRSQAGLIRFNEERVNIKNLIDENIINQELFSSNKEIEILSEVKDEFFIFTDKNMVNTIIRNLLSNAVKFTYRKGKILVSATIISNEVVVAVKDTGVGIPKENIEKLFRIDTKLSSPGTENEQGTGLGLKLSKEFVEKLGGKIWVESIENTGSEFKFSIPVKTGIPLD